MNITTNYNSKLKKFNINYIKEENTKDEQILNMII